MIGDVPLSRVGFRCVCQGWLRERPFRIKGLPSLSPLFATILTYPCFVYLHLSKLLLYSFFLQFRGNLFVRGQNNSKSAVTELLEEASTARAICQSVM